MNVSHLFVCYGNGCSRPLAYMAKITPGCEWVLEGEGEGCRLYDGPFVTIANTITVPGVDIEHEADILSRLSRESPMGLRHMPHGLYQLVEEEEECARCSTPRLVRVGEETVPEPKHVIREALAQPISEVMEYLHGAIVGLDWHGILWRREVECDVCRGFSNSVVWDNAGARKEPCLACHGTGKVEEYCKVEKKLFP